MSGSKFAAPSTEHPQPGTEVASLSDTAISVLELHLQPDYYQASVRTIAKAAGCSASHVRRLRSDPRWQAEFYARINCRIQSYIPELIEKSMESARMPGSDGLFDRRMLLSMAAVEAGSAQQRGHGPGTSDRVQRALMRARNRGAKATDHAGEAVRSDSSDAV